MFCFQYFCKHFLFVAFCINTSNVLMTKSVTLLTGHTRNISIPNCVQFSISTNACRGYCLSFAVPSSLKGFVQPITSMAECCNMMDSDLVETKVLCVDGFRTITFKSALSCSCYHCKKI